MQTALSNLANPTDFRVAALAFFTSLGYESPKTFDYPGLSFSEFAEALPGDAEINEERAMGADWKAVHLLFQFTDDELGTQKAIFNEGANRELFEVFNFVALELTGESYNRTQLANIARELNKPFQAPVIVLFRHWQSITLASVARREHKTVGGAHVLEKVTLLKDIRLPRPHAAHERILIELGEAKRTARNWTEFLARWNAVLDISELNKRFYRDLSNWFFAAREYARFPDKSENAVERGLIRLITRLIFTWFLKEKRDPATKDGLVPDALFDAAQFAALLKNVDGESDSYYRAVLQNLFFATLNREMKERAFAPAKGGAHGQKGEYGNTTLWRYESEFKNADAWRKLVNDVPFLNGGLFECLDHCSREGEYIDGFSRESKHAAHLPNKLFWGEKFVADLSDVYDDKKQKAVPITPILNLLHAYKFTIDENTPLEEDVALDPELLGKVFENLLASYNPETKTTARKQTGSFYTPREIVSYMVEEALAAYLESAIEDKSTPEFGRTFGESLRDLLSDSDARNAAELGFSHAQIEAIVQSLQRCTILDPACGSGAFPMGALSKMVALLKKLDPDNNLWQAAQLRAVAERLRADSANANAQQQARRDTEAIFNDNDPDYARKLFLIERCLFGVDIQPVALQIAKLRFFIALIINQRIDDKKPNRNIRALPNLETRFVAANTLIALPQTGAITPVDLPPLESALAKVRREHIAPRNRAKKKELEKQDKRLRGEIETLMREAGMGDSFITPIVGWNPYDQNAVAPFFDPERMFGPELKDGFDVVIGNPPYVLIGKDDFLRQYGTAYPLLAGKPDLYRMFIEASERLLRPCGRLSFIVPNTLLAIPSAEKLRRAITKNDSIDLIVDLASPVFGAVAVNNIILQIAKQLPVENEVLVGVADGENALEKLGQLTKIKQTNWLRNEKCEWTLQVSGQAEIVTEKLQQLGLPLRNVLDDVCLGMQVYHNTLHTPAQMESRCHHALSKRGRWWFPEYGGRHIKGFAVSTDKAVPFVDYAATTVYQKPDIRFFTNPRLIMREIVGDRLIVAYADQKFAVNKSCYILRSENLTEVDLKALQAVLSSTVVAFWVRLKGDKAKQALFPRITMNTLRAIPIPKSWHQHRVELSAKVDQILAAKAADASADVSRLEREIDELVAALYGLDESEKQLVGIG